MILNRSMPSASGHAATDAELLSASILILSLPLLPFSEDRRQLVQDKRGLDLQNVRASVVGGVAREGDSYQRVCGPGWVDDRWVSVGSKG